MSLPVYLTSPFSMDQVAELRSGDIIFLSGDIYTARDAAHQRLILSLEQGQAPPFDLEGAVIYYCGPSPKPPHKIYGSCGPTSSYRMDSFTPALLEKGVRGLIGKGPRGDMVKASLQKNKAVYLAATGGAGALLAQCITDAQLVAYPDLGPEAICRLTVKDMPLVCVNDIYGHDLYEQGRAQYCR